MNTMPYVYFEDKVVPAEEAKISIASNSLQYGNTCFAGIRGYQVDGKIRIFRLFDHHQRLMNASKIMGMDYFIEYAVFEKAIAALIEKNEPMGDFYIRPFIFSQTQQLAPKPLGLKFELAIYFTPMANYFDPNKGMRLMVSSWRKFSDISLPTKAKAGGCYIHSFLATAEAMRCGYDEALVTDQEGSIVEASVANLLISYRDRVLMPPIGASLLEGITQRTAIEFLEEEGIPVHFEKVDRSMIYTCDELLLLGTAAQVTFAESVDDRPIGQVGKSSATAPGHFCRLLREKFASVIAKKHPKAKDWITEFKTGRK